MSKTGYRKSATAAYQSGETSKQLTKAAKSAKSATGVAIERHESESLAAINNEAKNGKIIEETIRHQSHQRRRQAKQRMYQHGSKSGSLISGRRGISQREGMTASNNENKYGGVVWQAAARRPSGGEREGMRRAEEASAGERAAKRSES